MFSVLISAEFDIVTPMFLGDGDQEATSIRAQSLKSELVFWWRAMRFGELFSSARGDNKQSVDEAIYAALYVLNTAEKKLFGGPDGQGAFLLSVTEAYTDVLPRLACLNSDGSVENSLSKYAGSKRRLSAGAVYLGFGAIRTADKMNGSSWEKAAGQLDRSCFAKGGKFTLQFLFRPSTQDDTQRQMHLQEILKALKLMGLLGGLGSRRRRGWGSISLRSLQRDGDIVWRSPSTLDSYKSELRDLVGARQDGGDNWPLSAFCRQTDIRIGVPSFVGSLEALGALGEGLQRYRQWGDSGSGSAAPQVNGQASEMNFVADHDWFKKGTNRELQGKFTDNRGKTHEIVQLPQRASFGLPHNYYSKQSSRSDEMKMTVGGASDASDRRASPMLFHIHQMPDGAVFPVLTFFNNQFLADPRIWIDKPKYPTSAKPKIKAYQFDPSVITHFLDGRRPDGTLAPGGPYVPSERLWP